MPSGQPSVKAIAVVTAIASGRQKNVFMFQTQLALDESLIDPKFQIAMQQLTPEEYVLTIVPTLPALFELEDFYVRGNPHAGKKDVPNSASTLVQLLTGGQNER